MIEVGKVHKIDKNNIATVRFPRSLACKNCQMCFKPKNEMFVEIYIKNTQNAVLGESVSVKMSEQAVLTASAIVYIFPLVILAISLFATRKLKEIIAFAVAISATALSFIIISIIDKKMSKKKGYMPEMVSIIKTDNNTILEDTNNER